MRIDEFASAEEQMALWKLVNDNVWQAIETQRQQQAQTLPPAQTLAPHTAPVIASTAPKDGVFAQNLLQKKSPPHGDDRHSANGYSPHPPYKRQPAMGMARSQQFR